MQYYSGIVKSHFTNKFIIVNVIFICHMHCVGSLYDLATSSFGCETLQMVKALVHKLLLLKSTSSVPVTETLVKAQGGLW